MIHLVLALALAAGEAQPPAPAAQPVAAPAAPKRGLSELRKACYGGKGKALMSGVRKQFEDQAIEASLRNDFPTAVHWFRRVLAGGGEDPGTLRRLSISLASTRDPQDHEASGACAELADRLTPAKPARKGK